MIQSKQDYLYYLDQDKKALKINSSNGIIGMIREIFYPNYIWCFERTMRKLEYVKNVQMKSDCIFTKLWGGEFFYISDTNIEGYQ